MHFGGDLPLLGSDAPHLEGFLFIVYIAAIVRFVYFEVIEIKTPF